MTRSKQSAFAILRFDRWSNGEAETVELDQVLDRMAVVQVREDEEAARAEAARLNELQRERGVEATYVVIPTRLISP